MGYHHIICLDGVYISTKIQHLLAIVIASIIQNSFKIVCVYVLALACVYVDVCIYIAATAQCQ